MKAHDDNPIPKFLRHVYMINKMDASHSEYKLTNLNNGENLLTDVLRIENSKDKSTFFGSFRYLRLRTTGNWITSEEVTELRPTRVDGVYYGDRKKDGEKSLLIFRFKIVELELLECLEIKLIIDVFPNYYPLHRKTILNIIKTYKTR